MSSERTKNTLKSILIATLSALVAITSALSFWKPIWIIPFSVFLVVACLVIVKMPPKYDDDERDS